MTVVMHSKIAVKAVQIYHYFNSSLNVEDKKSSVLGHFRLIGNKNRNNDVKNIATTMSLILFIFNYC
jgi:replication initiation and membrane attachment protein DnaB